MQNPIDIWLNQVCIHLTRRRSAIRRELAAHLDDRIRILCTGGLTAEEAIEQALAAMGDPDELGRALAESHCPIRRRILMIFWIAIIILICIICAEFLTRG